jgi:hypothetical protein
MCRLKIAPPGSLLLERLWRPTLTLAFLPYLARPGRRHRHSGGQCGGGTPARRKAEGAGDASVVLWAGGGSRWSIGRDGRAGGMLQRRRATIASVSSRQDVVARGYGLGQTWARSGPMGLFHANWPRWLPGKCGALIFSDHWRCPMQHSSAGQEEE